jgi:predicted small lipoprotein YifL
LKIYLSTLIGLGLLFVSLSVSVTGCGKKGDLIRPVPPSVQQTLQEEPEDKQKSKKGLPVVPTNQ